jgi:hypothetical protein
MPITAELQHEIDIILETTLMLAPKGAKLKDLAKSAYSSGRSVFDQAQESIMLDRIEWMLARKRQTITPVDPVEPPQYMLPGMERIPQRLTMRDGRRIARKNAILAQVREYRAALLAKITSERNTLVAKDPTQDPRILALDRLIELMIQYGKPGKHVTVGDVMEAERKKQEWSA